MNSIKADNSGSGPITWSIAELLQFEQFREQDRQQDEAVLAERDRRIWREYQATGGEPQRRRVYRFWLWQRQQASDLPSVDAGQLFGQTLASVSVVLMLLGFLSGICLAGSALYYDGSVPVNVALFLGLIIAPQLLLLLGLVVSVLLSAWVPGWFVSWYQPPLLLLRWLHERIWKRALRYANRSGLADRGAVNNTGGEQQDSRKIRQLLLEQVFDLYQPLLATRALRLMQLMGIAFNLGVLGTLLVLLAFTDRAFGWQSSLTSSPDTVMSILEVLAWPWTLLAGAGAALPSAEQIAATHIQLGGVAGSFQGAEFRAWWPFLLCSVLVYGLLPRVLVWAWSLLRESQLLAAIDFEGYHYQGLWRRMQSIDLHSQSHDQTASVEASQVLSPVEPVRSVSQQVYVLVDTLQRYSRQYLQSWLPPVNGGEHDLLEVKGLAELQAGGNQPVWLVVEGWQPPIEESLAELAAAARRLQVSGVDLHLLLLGKPSPDGSKLVTPRLAEVWRKKLDLLQCPNLMVHADTGAAGSEGDTL
ncbi:DUF2868 domain-containing protein [Parathalassolituus penaei]|uniref:DUF2868 domain-containing protein n=1 Tax=Parathalassolituus penaei TaxID=2997323 RepID=A0A9X3ITQ5_9GAMM|nr:DUF2868 domain-containing protein [Parathalassolituus penaei]MCY0965408.1 DUF2868 domain-containing protein [Parathalassolituus penaei]